MKKFLEKFLIFLVIIIVGSLFLDFAISKGLSDMKDYRFQSWNEIQEGNINAEIVINGNSRALSHFVPAIFDSVYKCKTYNLGFGGHPFNEQYFKYGFYINQNKPPKLVIQNVDFFTLSDLFIIGHEREQVLPFVYNSYIRTHLMDFGFSAAEVYLPLVRYFGYQQIIKNGLFEFFSIKKYHNKVSTQGFVAEEGNWNPYELSKLKSIKFINDSFSVGFFEKYLSELKQNNVNVVLVNSPVYYKATEKLENKEEMNNYYNDVAKKFGFKYLDFTNDSICNDSTKFVLAIHLNENGAKIFTKKLINEINKLSILN